MKKIAIILAGGKGKRMKSAYPKQFIILKNYPILFYSLQKFTHFDKIILVLPKNHINLWKSLCQEYKINIPHQIVKGGKTRFHSVRSGLDIINNKSIVAIHDGVRPFVSIKLINQCITLCSDMKGVIPALKMQDSIREIHMKRSKSINRSKIVTIQTPQVFMSRDLKNAYKQTYHKDFTDDANVFEKYGGNIELTKGDRLNIKITTHEDLKLANFLIEN